MSSPIRHFAVTVLGRDRPGIIAATTDALAGVGVNLEDSSMTLLRGHFAMTLICAGPLEVVDLEPALAAVAADPTLSVSVREVAEAPGGAGGAPWVLSVHGADRPGIVSAVVAEVAAAGGNITDLTTRLVGDLYLLIAELDLPETVDPEVVRAAITAAGARLGVGATLRPAETDEL